MGQTDQRVRVTKTMIRRGFMELLNQKPLQSISIKELCARAGINRGTFYAHYKDIYDLLEQLEEEMLADFQKALEPFLRLPASPDKSTHLRITTGIFRCLQENADLCTVILGPYGDTGFAARLVSAGRKIYMETYSAYFRNAAPKQTEQYYTFVSYGCVGLLRTWLIDGVSSTAEELAQAAEGIMLYGINFLQKEPEGPIFLEKNGEGLA